jgi:transposase
VNRILWDGNRVMERQYATMVKVYPQRGEVHLSAVHPARLDKVPEAFPWSGTDCRLTKTAVFVERFFHKTPYKELAERFGVTENTVVTMYRQAVEQVGKIIEALDARREGLKAVREPGRRLTEEERYFLLVKVFGFSMAEVARMFNLDRRRVGQRLKRMAERYGGLFTG